MHESSNQSIPWIVTQTHSVVFGSLQGLVCVMIGAVVTMIEENPDVIIGVWRVNYGNTYTHFSAVFCLYFYRIYVLL
jgi:hypothetical protein